MFKAFRFIISNFWNGTEWVYLIKHMFIVFFLLFSSFTPPQPTGMLLVLSWSSLPCRALLASLQESSPLHTSLPLRGSTAHLLLGSCSLFQVSHCNFVFNITCPWMMCDAMNLHAMNLSDKVSQAEAVHNVTDIHFDVSLFPTLLALFVLLAMAIYTGVTVNFLGKRFGDWRFSWSYILGWVALLMTFFAGLFIEREVGVVSM